MGLCDLLKGTQCVAGTQIIPFIIIVLEMHKYWSTFYLLWQGSSVQNDIIQGSMKMKGAFLLPYVPSFKESAIPFPPGYNDNNGTLEVCLQFT